MQCPLYHQPKLSQLQQWGKHLYNQGQWQLALKVFQQALPLCLAKKDHLCHADILTYIGLIHCHLDERAWGIKRLEQALQIAQDTGNRFTVGVILNHLGKAYRQTGQDRKALGIYLRSLAIFRYTNNAATVAELLNCIGEIHNSLGEFERAIRCCRQALKMFQALERKSQGESIALYNLGEAYCQMGRSRQALVLFEQALAIQSKRGDRLGEAKTLESLGTIYVRLNQDWSALQLYQQAIDIYECLNYSTDGDKETCQTAIAKNLDYIGAVYYKMGNTARALGHHFQALEIWHSLSNTVSIERFLYEVSSYEKFLYHLDVTYECLYLQELGKLCYQQMLEILRIFGHQVSEQAIENYLKNAEQMNR